MFLLPKPKQDLTKITTNLNTNVLKYVDQFAEDNGLTRTTALTILLSSQLVSLGYGVKK